MTSKWTPGPSRHRKQIQVLPKATQNGDKPAKVSKAIPKAAKVHQKSSEGAPKTPERLQKDPGKHPKRHPETKPKPNPEPETLIFTKCL